ncbi:MAG TPA: hypothetical protein VGO58_12545 [Chitinophagaceae bacterium]|jgi:hypothetical protein|nr:hypothetical protein [Chitinophagaceae bacterium]
MLAENISDNNMPELFDLLVIHTKELLDLLNHRSPDGMLIYQKKTDIQLIQSLIERRKAELRVLPMSVI